MAQRVQVTFFIPQLEVGGSEGQLLLLADRLNTSVFQASIITFKCTVEVSHHIHLRVLAKRVGVDITFLPRLLSALRELQPHILHTVSSTANIWGLAATLFNKPAVTLGAIRGREWGLSGWHYRLGRMLYRRLDRMIVNSPTLKPLVAGRYGLPPERIIFIPNGIETDRFRPLVENERKDGNLKELRGADCVVGWVGNIRPEKGFAHLVAIADLVVASRSGVKFLVVGGGPDFEVARRMVKDVGLEGFFLFAEQVEDVAPSYRQMDLLVNTSLSEGMCTSILEGMASGLSVVASDIPANRQLVNDGVDGFLVPLGDHQTFARRIVELADDVSFAVGMGKRGRRKVEEEFSVQRMVANYEEQYTQLIGERS